MAYAGCIQMFLVPLHLSDHICLVFTATLHILQVVECTLMDDRRQLHQLMQTAQHSLFGSSLAYSAVQAVTYILQIR